jgi:hypothetical protein
MYILLMVTMLDGSQVNLQVDRAATFDVTTKYGTLKIPVADMVKVNFGVHYDNEELYKSAVKDFANGKYKSRDGAFKFLSQNQRWAWKWLKSVENDSDLEVKNRAVALLKLYKSTPPLTDDVGLRDGTIDGQIQQKSISGESVSLGMVTVKVSQIKSIATRADNAEITLSLAEGWKKAGYVNGSCEVNASGHVDMWPQQGGRWMAGPNGQINGGLMHESYPAGSLLGRLNGKVFLLGEHFYAQNIGRGELEVRINGAPWSTTFEGEYRVKVE